MCNLVTNGFYFAFSKHKVIEMAILKRYKIFLVSAFTVAAFSLVFLMRYSSISNINVKLTGSAELGLKYLNNLKVKLSQNSTSEKRGDNSLNSAGQKDNLKIFNPVTKDNFDHLVTRSLEKNLAEAKASLREKTELSTSIIQTKVVTESALSPVFKPSTQPSLITTTPHDKTVNSEGNLSDDLEACPAKPSSLVGPLFVDQDIPQMEELDKQLSSSYGGWVLNGGAWAPTECKARTKMALIVPFRNRYEQLGIFVRHMHPMLKRQNVDYRIIIVEQSGTTPFNRAMLFNIGYKEALKFQEFDCFIFHDVDLIPEDDRNMYTCPTSPRHLSVAIDKFSYRLPYTTIFGGAGSFKRADFEAINGFSNKFWGWGGEDDDLYNRITSKGFKLTRPAVKLARYKMIKAFHKSSAADPNRMEKLRDSGERMKKDGLNSLVYKVLKIAEKPMYTMVTVEVDPELV